MYYIMVYTWSLHSSILSRLRVTGTGPRRTKAQTLSRDMNFTSPCLPERFTRRQVSVAAMGVTLQVNTVVLCFPSLHNFVFSPNLASNFHIFHISLPTFAFSRSEVLQSHSFISLSLCLQLSISHSHPSSSVSMDDIYLAAGPSLAASPYTANFIDALMAPRGRPLSLRRDSAPITSVAKSKPTIH